MFTVAKNYITITRDADDPRHDHASFTGTLLRMDLASRV